MADERNVLIMAESGGILFIWHEPGIYEIHTTFLKAKRDAYAIRASFSAYHWMFTHTDCMTLLTRVPAFNIAALRACEIGAAMLGAQKEFERKAVWPTVNGLSDMSFWSLRIEDWVRHAPGLIDIGKHFHHQLHAEFERHGVTEPLHADEDCHDQQVGALVEMIRGGQPEKGIVLFNRWAKFAGYQPIELIAKSPFMIKTGDAILQMLDDNRFKVVKCL